MASRVSSEFLAILFSLVFVCSLVSVSCHDEESATTKEYVLTLDHTNFTDIVSKNDFVVVEFYAPWCGHCKSLAPEYEKAASVLSGSDPSIIIAKVDANEEINKPLATQYEVQGFPTLKIFRNGGKNVQEYKGPREADGIVAYLKKQSGPASAEINSAEDAGDLVENKIVIVGVFPMFSGEEFESFLALAEKLRSDYEFRHTLDAKHLPRGEPSVSGPLIRLFKPFDELYIESKDFSVEAAEKFIEESSIPMVTLFNNDPENHHFLIKFFNTAADKAMLFLNFSSDLHDAFNAKYRDVAAKYKGSGIIFLMGDLDASQNAFQYFGLKEDQAPLILIQTNDGQKYLKMDLDPDHVDAWVKDYKDGKVSPFKKSEPIPEVNNEPVKVVVADNIQEVVFNSAKNVLIEFYAPWCGHCKKLAPILDEVALSYENDANVIIAKLDGTANDIPSHTFEIQGYPTLYFNSASGKLSQYDGGRTKEDIIEFIEKNRDIATTTATIEESVKDEL